MQLSVFQVLHAAAQSVGDIVGTSGFAVSAGIASHGTTDTVLTLILYGRIEDGKLLEPCNMMATEGTPCNSVLIIAI